MVGRKMSRYQILNLIVTFDQKYLKRVLVNKDAKDSLTLKLQKISLNEHYARLYGPTLLVAQNKVQEILEDEPIQEEVQENNPRKYSRKFSKFMSRVSPAKDVESQETDKEREVLLQSFKDNTFDKFHKKKFDMDLDDQVKVDLEKMVERRTKLLWKVAIDSTLPKTEIEMAEIKVEDEETQERIKKAYDKSKQDFK